MVDNRVSIVTPLVNELPARDLSNPGVTLSTFCPGANQYARSVACCDAVNRDAVCANGKVVCSALNGQMVAVDAMTGTLLWPSKLADPTTDKSPTGAPVLANDRVIVGNAGRDRL